MLTLVLWDLKQIGKTNLFGNNCKKKSTAKIKSQYKNWGSLFFKT